MDQSQGGEGARRHHRVPKFLKFTVRLASNISESELNGLKYLCRDKIPKKKLENIDQCYKLFHALFEQQELEENDFGLLVELFGTIGRNDLIAEINKYQNENGDNINDESAQVPLSSGRPVRADLGRLPTDTGTSRVMPSMASEGQIGHTTGAPRPSVLTSHLLGTQATETGDPPISWNFRPKTSTPAPVEMPMEAEEGETEVKKLLDPEKPHWATWGSQSRPSHPAGSRIPPRLPPGLAPPQLSGAENLLTDGAASISLMRGNATNKWSTDQVQQDGVQTPMKSTERSQNRAYPDLDFPNPSHDDELSDNETSLTQLKAAQSSSPSEAVEDPGQSTSEMYPGTAIKSIEGSGVLRADRSGSHAGPSPRDESSITVPKHVVGPAFLSQDAPVTVEDQERVVRERRERANTSMTQLKHQQSITPKARGKVKELYRYQFELAEEGVQGFKNEDLFPYLDRGGRHSKPKECRNDLFEIMTSCWAELPNDRPGFADLGEDLLSISPTGQPPVRPGSRNPDGESGTVIYESLDDAQAIPRVAAEFKRSDKEDPETSRRSVKNITQEKKILVAQSDFQSDAANSISFIKGDRFERLSWGPWPLVVHMTTGQRGYVPADNVAEEDTSDTPVVPLLGHLTPGQKGDVPENFVAEVGFQPDVNLSTAEDMLMAEGNGQGVFLIRGAFAPTKQEPLVLAVLCQGKENTRIVKNHRLKVDDSGHYFIDEKSKFETLHQLVTHYKGNPDLGCVLTRPCQCPVVQDLSSQKQGSFEIPRRFLEKGERIGNGNACYVYKGLWYGHFPVAIKCAKPKSMSAAQLLEEAAAMEPLKHKNLVSLYGICSDEPIFIVTELVPFGDLRSYMISETEQGRKLKFVDRLEVAQQVVQAMTYLESKRFVHRDLAARNILVGANRVMKVADFGLARSFIADTYVSHGRTFPLKWTALEAILFAKFSSKSDVWSFGILLVEIVTDGEEPYPGLTREDVTHKLKQGNRHPQPEGCPADLYEIMFTCWDKEPAERPTFAEIQPMLDELIADCRK